MLLSFKFLLLYCGIILVNSDLKYFLVLKFKFTVFKILVCHYILFVSALHFLQRSLIEISEENRQVLCLCMLVHVCVHTCSCALSLYKGNFLKVPECALFYSSPLMLDLII